MSENLLEYKEAFRAMKNNDIAGSTAIYGLYMVIAGPSCGKSYCMRAIAQYFNIKCHYVNEPDSIGKDGEMLFMTFADVEQLIESSNSHIILIDSMSIMEWSSVEYVKNIMKDSTSGARTEGISPSLILNLTYLSQKASSKKKFLWISFSLADYKDWGMMFGRFQGYSNGVIFIKESNTFGIKASFRGSPRRDRFLDGETIDEILDPITDLEIKSNTVINGNAARSKESGTITCDITSI